MWPKSAGTIEQLAEEIQKPIIRKFKRRKVSSSFKDAIWRDDLADMKLRSTFSKGICFYYVLLIFSVNMYGLFL